MRNIVRSTCVGAVMLGFATACGPSGGASDVSPSASTSATSTASSPSAVQLHYTLTAPTNWTVTKAFVQWTGKSHVPGPGDAAADTYKSPETDPWFVITEMPAGGENLQAWIKGRIADDSLTFSSEFCGNENSLERPTTLGGENAEMRGFNCPQVGPATVAVQVLALHGGEGWLVMCGSERRFGKPLADFSNQCEQWLSSFKFF